MKWFVIFFLQSLAIGSLLCQNDEAFPLAISREFDAPVTVLMSSLNDGSVSQSVLTVQGPLKPII